MERILKSLPSKFQANLINGLTNALSQFSEADVSIKKKPLSVGFVKEQKKK